MNVRLCFPGIFPLWGMLCFLAFLSGIPAASAEAALLVVDRTDIIYQNVSGAGSASSFLDQGLHVLQEVDLEHETALNDSWNSKLLTSVRYTDSDQFDTERLSLERLSWTMASARSYLTLGDYFANFTQYSLNKSLKGIGYEKKFGQRDSYLRLAAGTFDGQWEYLYDDVDNEPVSRLGAGVRLQHAADRLQLGLNLVRIDDDNQDGRNLGQDVYRQNVAAFDWEYRGEQHKLSGEHAYSDTVKTSTGGDNQNSGTAHRINLYSRIASLKVRAKVEQVSPDFLSLGGGATADRQRFYLKTDLKISRNVATYVQYDHYRNNLDEQLAATTRNTAFELGLAIKKLFDRKTLNATTSLRRKKTVTDTATVDQTSDRFKLSLKDKFFGVLTVDGDYEVIFDDDNVAGNSPTNRLYSLSLLSRHRLDNGSWQLRPRLRISLQEMENATSGGEDLTDQLSFSLSANRGNGTELGLNVDRTKTDPFDPTQDNSTVLRYGAYWQLATELLKNGRLRCDVSRNEYDFSTATNNYEELIAKLSLNFEFDR